MKNHCRVHVPAALILLGLTITVTHGVSAQGTHAEPIMDPAFNLKAYDVTIPSGWKYQGLLVPGTSCDSSPTPVFRMYSPDGLTEMRRMPRFDWTWSNAPYAAKQQGDCLSLKQISAIDFAHYLAKIQGVQFVGEMRVAPATVQIFQQGMDADNAAIQRQAGQRPFSGSIAAARVEYQNGSFTIEEQYRVVIHCSHHNLASLGGGGGLFSEQCGADVRVLRAPKGKLEAHVNEADTYQLGAAPDQRWLQAYNAAQQAKTDRVVAGIHANMQVQQQQFQQAQRVRARQNQEFQASLQAGYAAHNSQAAETQNIYAQHNANEMANMNARHTPASDTVDFALDQQTVSGTGGTVKVPAGYNQTWSNGNGQYFQTNNLNTNPNGSLPGNWTQTTQVHGNGQPY